MTDQEIAKKAKLQHIVDIADKWNIPTDALELYGKYKAKLPIHLIDEQKVKDATLVLVSAISPTPAGEGKTTMSIGLSESLNKIGKKTTVVLREPSLGPVFGIKGGATGGGYSQVLPMEDINLHFTGDFSAVEKAHNLLAALIDNNLQFYKRSLNLDPRRITWKRVMDMNDRALRSINVGMGGISFGVPRQTGFDITAASEIMAILCLSKDIADLKRRISNILVGYTYDRKPVFAKQLNAQGAMTALLKDAIKPNLVQTMEGNAAIIHGGPFANIAQGTNTVLATKMGMSLSPYVVTEAGFGMDLGGEKFLDIKCQYAGLSPKVLVLTATLKALKYHGGVPKDEVKNPNPQALKKGLPNLGKHIENAKKFGIKVVVALNKFVTDQEDEIQILRDFVHAESVPFVVADIWAKGGDGGEELAKTVSKLAEEQKEKFIPTYTWDQPLEDKIHAIATKIYGAEDVVYETKARRDLRNIKALNLGNLAVCIAKTQYSFSDDPKKLGRPESFKLNIREIELAAGAGFIVPITGDMMRMPGLPSIPAAENMDITDDGEITGLF